MRAGTDGRGPDKRVGVGQSRPRGAYRPNRPDRGRTWAGMTHPSDDVADLGERGEARQKHWRTDYGAQVITPDVWATPWDVS